MPEVLLGESSSGLLTIELDDLTRHAVILGSTGSGKTGLGLAILESALKHGVRVLAIDVKGELTGFSDAAILTPGSDRGIRVSFLSGRHGRGYYRSLASSLAEQVKVAGVSSRRVATLLSKVLREARVEDLGEIPKLVLNPPFSTVGSMNVEEFMPKSRRRALAAELTSFLYEVAQLAEGVPLDIGRMLSLADCIVLYVSHLDEKMRYFFVERFLASVYEWVKDMGSSKELKYLLYFDETYGFIPPYPREPLTKKWLMRLVKEARAYGLGVILSTQNPVDVDYKVLTNAATWFVGLLRTENDRRRVIEGLGEIGVDRRDVAKAIATLKTRQFIMVKPDRIEGFIVRDMSHMLRGPRPLNEVVVSSRVRDRFMSLGYLRVRLERGVHEPPEGPYEYAYYPYSAQTTYAPAALVNIEIRTRVGKDPYVIVDRLLITCDGRIARPWTSFLLVEDYEEGSEFYTPKDWYEAIVNGTLEKLVLKTIASKVRYEVYELAGVRSQVNETYEEFLSRALNEIKRKEAEEEAKVTSKFMPRINKLQEELNILLQQREKLRKEIRKREFKKAMSAVLKAVGVKSKRRRDSTHTLKQRLKSVNAKISKVRERLEHLYSQLEEARSKVISKYEGIEVKHNTIRPSFRNTRITDLVVVWIPSIVSGSKIIWTDIPVEWITITISP